MAKSSDTPKTGKVPKEVITSGKVPRETTTSGKPIPYQDRQVGSGNIKKR